MDTRTSARTRAILAVAGSLLVASWTSAAHGDEPGGAAAGATGGQSSEGAPIVLEIGRLPPGVDEADLRARLERELGARLIDAAHVGQAVRGTLYLDADDGEATARFQPTEGEPTERTVPVPAGRNRRTATLVLLSGNVGRDESEAVRAMLLARGARQKKRPTLGASRGADVDPSARNDEAARAGSRRDTTSRIDPDPRHPICSSREGQSFFFAGADFVPMLGTSLADRDATLGASLNVIGGLSGGLRGLQIGSVFNVVRGSACGLQIGGVVNITRDVAGLQIGGAANITRDVAGLQIGGAANVTGDVTGLQVGGAANITRDMAGLQIGGAANFTREARGLQIGGAVNVASRFAGLQIAGAANITSEVRGLQVGAIDLAGNVQGAQIGAINVAGKVRGVQIGAINYADDSTFSIGAISIVRKGRSHLDVWGTETGLLTAAFKHGGRYFHNYYGVGIRPFEGDPKVAFTLGIGGHVPVTSWAFLDIDALANTVHKSSDFRATPTFLSQLRAVFGVRVARGLAVSAGPSYNVSVADTEEEAALSLLGSTLFTSGTRTFVRGWPGFSVGLQAF